MKKTYLFSPFSLLFSAFLLLGFFGAANLQAQKNIWKKAYADRLEKGSKMIDAGALWTFEKTRDGQFILKNYFFDTGVITSLQTYSDSNKKTKNGPFFIWDDEGRLTAEQKYLDDKAQGTFKYFHAETGKISTIGKYLDDERTGEWRDFREDGTLLSVYNYGKTGKVEGEKTFFDEKGAEPVRREFFEGGKMLRSEPPLGKPSPDEVYFFVDKMPEYPGGEQELLIHYAKNIRYPKDARENGIQGRVIVSFVVEKDGEVTEVNTKRGLSCSLKSESIRVTKLLKNFSPGTLNGEPVRVKMNIPVMFKLE